MSTDDAPIVRGQVIAGGQRVTVEDDGAQLLAAAVLQRMIADARQGDAAAAWAAWAGMGLHLARQLGLDDVIWFTRLRAAGIEKPEVEPAEDAEPDVSEPARKAPVFQTVAGTGAAVRMGERRQGDGPVTMVLKVTLPVNDYEGRDILRRFCQLLTMCQGDGRAAVAELVQDGEYLARVLRWADLRE